MLQVLGYLAVVKSGVTLNTGVDRAVISWFTSSAVFSRTLISREKRVGGGGREENGREKRGSGRERKEGE